jgi:hypothetical protein
VASSSLSPVAKWQQFPTSSAKQRDVVPSKALSPLGAWDRMPNGEQLGHCPTCGADEWWDNRSRKASGQMKRNAPDYVCAVCGHARWIGGGDKPGLPPERRTPRKVVARATPQRRSAPEADMSGRADELLSAVPQCEAFTRRGARCQNRAMAGSRFCGPHADAGTSTTLCRGMTKQGAPCRAAAVRGSEYCPQHQQVGKCERSSATGRPVATER